jgi:WD40 repeat protein
MFLAVVMVPTVMAGEPGLPLNPLGTLEGARPSVYAPIAFSPDGKTLAASDLVIKDDGSMVHSVKLWDVKKRMVIATLPAGNGVGDSSRYAVAFSPDGKTLFTGGADVTLWDVATGKKKASFKGRSAVAFSPDGKTVAAVSEDAEHRRQQTVKLWDLSTGKEKASLKGHAGAVFSAAFSPDGKLLAVGSGISASNGQPSGGEVKLWDVATGRERASLKAVVKLKFTAKSVAYLRSEGVPKDVLKKLAALNDKEFGTEEEFEREFPKILAKILDKDQRAKYADLVQLEALPVLDPFMVWVWSVAFSPDGKTLASADVYGNVLLWDVQGGKRSATLQAFNPEGRGESINGAFSVAFSPDGKTLAAGTVHGIKLWDVQSGKQVGGLNRPSATVWAVAFSPDGKTVATAGSKRVIGPLDRLEGDETLSLWELIPSRKAGM